MGNFNQYDKAAAKYFQNLNIKTVPVISWDFHHILFDGVKEVLLDVNRLNKIATKNKWVHNNFDLKAILNEKVIIVTDAKLSIVFASHNLVKMNGYSEQEVLGKSPKIFHGEATCLKTSNEIREAIQLQQPFEKTVLNYKKNGETYQCLIKGFPIFNLKGEISNFIAFEKAA